jgi:DNA adenine methylase
VKHSRTPLRYAGGKSRAYGFISTYIPFWPKPKRIISPFIGGGSLEVRWANELDIEVIGYDVFDMLVNFWEVLLSQPTRLSEELSKITPDDKTYKEIKEVLMSLDKTQDMLKDWKTDSYKRYAKISLDKIERASLYYFNHNTSYGPGYLGWGSSVYLQADKWKQMCKNINNFKCGNLSVKQADYRDVIPNYKKDLLYLDPPYYLEQDKDNKMFKGIYPMRNIPVHHDGFDHEALRDMLHNHEGSFVLSYNNCETIREYYKDFHQVFPKWTYSMGTGETRIGKNRKEMGIDNQKDSHEILIIKE